MSGSDKRPHVLARTQFNLLNLVLNTEVRFIFCADDHIDVLSVR